MILEPKVTSDGILLLSTYNPMIAGSFRFAVVPKTLCLTPVNTELLLQILKLQC